MPDRVKLSLTIREAQALSRIIEVALKFGLEGKDILHFGDKRKSREIQDRLFEDITTSDEFA